MVCRDIHCHKTAHYIVVNPKAGLEEQLDKHMYCLKHAREVFRLDALVHSHNVAIYRVELITEKV